MNLTDCELVLLLVLVAAASSGGTLFVLSAYYREYWKGSYQRAVHELRAQYVGDDSDNSAVGFHITNRRDTHG